MALPALRFGRRRTDRAMPARLSCGERVGKLWIVSVLIHKKVHLFRYSILRSLRRYMMIFPAPQSLRMARRTEREAFRSSGPAGRKAFGWTGPLSQEAFGTNASGDVRSALRSTLRGPRVRAPGVSFFCAPAPAPRPYPLAWGGAAHPENATGAAAKGKRPGAMLAERAAKSRQAPTVRVRIWTRVHALAPFS